MSPNPDEPESNAFSAPSDFRKIKTKPFGKCALKGSAPTGSSGVNGDL
jgi:hypothetical protein